MGRSSARSGSAAHRPGRSTRKRRKPAPTRSSNLINWVTASAAGSIHKGGTKQMRLQICTLLALGGCAAIAFSAPANAASLKVTVDSTKEGKMLPNKYAFCVAAAQGHSKGGPNINPRVSWSKGPKGTQSYAVILFDTDSPKEQREKMNKEGETLTAAVPRQTFYHWVLVDIPANVTSI